MFSVRFFTLGFVIAFQFACNSGGGGSDSGSTNNLPPVASNVSIVDGNAGNVLVGDSLSGSYSYSDNENDSEGQSIFRWFRNNVAISGATQSNYTVVSADLGQALSFEVTPIAASGSRTGTAVTSTTVSVKASTDVVFVLDSSASMTSYLTSLQSQINTFAANLAAADIDYQIIVVTAASAFCAPAPLGSGNCVDSSNAPLYQPIDVAVSSGKVLSAVQSNFTAINALLRAGSTLHIIVLSDDDDTLSALDFNSFLQAQSSRLKQARLHALVAGSDPAVASNPCFGIASAAGRQAINYSVFSGGQVHDLCDVNWLTKLDDLASTIFSDQQSDVVASYFPNAAYFTQNVALATVDANSASMISALSAVGGWGGTGKFSVDFSLNVESAASGLSKTSLTPNGDFYVPDCDQASVPLPPGGALEGESGYACLSAGDCRLLIWSAAENRLYELYKANYDGAVLSATCLALWQTNQVPANDGRGESCVSADGAGMPITPLLASADEVAAGEVNHALRFLLPNARQRSGGYVHPATSAVAASGGATLPPRGAHFRLRADYPIDSLPSAGAKVIARALQRYGMYLVEGGNIPLTVQSDKNSSAKWSGLLAVNDLAALTVDDFEIMNSGAFIAQASCARMPITE